MFGDTQRASIGVLVLFLLKVAGGEEAEYNVKIKSIIPSSFHFSARGPVRTSSLWSMPRITLLPAISRVETDLHRSSANKALGFGLGSSLVSLKYLQCWFQTNPGLRGFLIGQYAAYMHKVVATLPWKRENYPAPLNLCHDLVLRTKEGTRCETSTSY